MSVKRPVSRFWLGAGGLVAFLALWAIQGFGGEVAISREIAVQGDDLPSRLAEPVAEMKRELASRGCSQFSLTYWSVGTPARLRVEVRCRDWMRDVPLSQEPTAGNSPR